MAPENDESQWDSDPLVHALRAPGTPAELTGEADFVTAFRAQQPRSNVRPLVRRFGIGATTAVTTIALSAGVAAAYGRVLPDPVQRIAHSVLGQVGVPAPTAPKPVVPAAVPTRSTSSSTGTVPATTPTPSTTRGPDPVAPSASPTSGTSQMTQPPSVTPTPTGGPTPTPSPTPTRASSASAHQVPAAVSASTTSTQVVAGSAVTVTGVVTASDGTPLRGRTVRLIGSSGGKWTRYATGRTEANGHIALDSAPLTQNARLWLRASHDVHSAPLRVSVLPVLTATVAEADGTSTISLTVRGGQAGDEVRAYRRKGDSFVKIGSAVLGTEGTAVLTVPTRRHPVRVLLRLPGSKLHGKAQTSVIIGRPPSA